MDHSNDEGVSGPREREAAKLRGPIDLHLHRLHAACMVWGCEVVDRLQAPYLYKVTCSTTFAAGLTSHLQVGIFVSKSSVFSLQAIV